MARVTLRVLDGADRGRVFDALGTPITIGREEGNSIQLNDERVSRFHVKIQEDNDQLVLTDLDSTNGTKVNGEDVQLRILRFGDMVHVGRSILVVGTRDEIANRLSQLQQEKASSNPTGMKRANPEKISSLDLELHWRDSDELQEAMFYLDPPQVPDGLRPGQAAQLAELIEYLHIRLRRLLASVRADEKAEKVNLDCLQWQELLDIQSRLAEYLRMIGDPGSLPGE